MIGHPTERYAQKCIATNEYFFTPSFDVFHRGLLSKASRRPSTWYWAYKISFSIKISQNLHRHVNLLFPFIHTLSILGYFTRFLLLTIYFWTKELDILNNALQRRLEVFEQEKVKDQVRLHSLLCASIKNMFDFENAPRKCLLLLQGYSWWFL